MPLFEYRCSACGRLEEVLQKHTDPAPDECPNCHAKSTMGKELSLSAFHLKGGGWYKDLYASSSPAASSSPDSSSSSSTTTTKTETKAETKTETKTETKAAAPASPAPAASSSSSSSST